MGQTEEGELPFDKIPERTKGVQLFDDIHSPVLSGEKVVKKGCKLVFDQPNVLVINEKTGEKIQKIIQEVKQDNSDDIIMTVPFDKKSLSWKIDSDRKAKPLINLASNIHQIRSKEVLCGYLYQAAGYPMKKRWLAAIKKGFFKTWSGLTYELV